MMKWFRRKKGQNVAEYAILIALVVGAIIAMQKFAQRGLQARVRGATEYMVKNTDFGNAVGSTDKYDTAQYEPYYLQSDYQTNKYDTESKSGSGKAENFGIDSDSTRTGSSSTILNTESTIGNGLKFE